MSRFRELLQHLGYERAHGRSAPLALLRKTAMLVPNAIAFALFNFGSAFRKSAPAAAPSPTRAAVVPQWRVDPSRIGIPLSDDTAASIVFDAFELVDDPIAVMNEIRRVATPEARVELTFAGTWSHPAQRRIATPEMLAWFGNSIEEMDGKRCLMRIAKDATSVGHPTRIDIGCGTAKRNGYCGIDLFPLSGVDIVRDVERLGLPFSDDTIAAVFASHFLEHVGDVVFVMNEIHRVCCDGAEVEIIVPTLLGPWAAGDPTHKHVFNARTFGYFTGEAAESYAGIRGRFELIEQSVSTSMHVRLRVVKSAGTAAS